MSNRRYKTDEQFTVEMKFNIHLHELSNYHAMDQDAIDAAVKEFKDTIGEHLIDKLRGGDIFEEVIIATDYCTYDVVAQKPKQYGRSV